MIVKNVLKRTPHLSALGTMVMVNLRCVYLRMTRRVHSGPDYVRISVRDVQ